MSPGPLAPPETIIQRQPTRPYQISGPRLLHSSPILSRLKNSAAPRAKTLTGYHYCCPLLRQQIAQAMVNLFVWQKGK